MIVQYVFLPTQQAETYLEIYVLIQQCPTSPVKNGHLQFSGSSRKLLIKKYTKMTGAWPPPPHQCPSDDLVEGESAS